MKFFQDMSPSLGCLGLLNLFVWQFFLGMMHVLTAENIPFEHYSGGVMFVMFAVHIILAFFPIVYNACLEDQKND